MLNQVPVEADTVAYCLSINEFLRINQITLQSQWAYCKISGD